MLTLMPLRLVFTSLGVYALLVHPQASYRAMIDEVRLNNLNNVFRPNPAIPNSFGVNHDRRSMFTLVKAAGFISADGALKPSDSQFLFEQKL
jgi:hypothetical protein